ncbi:retrovirus-related Pol polyprotein from type-2 retrotransposable element R2DM [Trichonephila inaurata madagascariensis]|uniref:Retrovirus-related Pol polyprotein from type-2 retrotransposable element R2DM n=1 Tax=Trichonephila inaurata madagascariensis TaxID=2747483 RepID=A0A8X6WZH8_9ARAC|nr:retrovirus-related Pol polyprotein from type-2 retrotransposable element R2DM [Trichonephila inaurata madagascariensis]
MPPGKQAGKGGPNKKNSRSIRRQCGAHTVPDYSVLSRVCHNTSGLSTTIHLRRKIDGQTHTKVVRFAQEDVADASACPSTPAYNVHCPDGIRLHEASTSQANNTPALPSRSEASSSNQVLAGDASVTCEICGHKCRTRKGLTYHKLRDHGVPVGKKKEQRANEEEDRDSNPSPPPNHDTTTVSLEDVVASTCTAGVSVLGETIRLTFPLPKVLACPISGCPKAFSTAKWYSTSHSLKRHLTAVHRMPNRQVQYWCAPCGKRIRKKPSQHPCILNHAMREDQSAASEWPCADCEERFTSRMGLLNHQKSHRRRALIEELPVLKIPDGPKQRRAKKDKKLAPLSAGDPGSMRLAPPPNHLPDTPPRSNPGQENGEDPTLRGRIDLRVPDTLKPFLEPLNALLEMDEINDARAHFEETVDNITAAVQDYFHLQPTRPETNRPNNGGLDLEDPQRVQKAYRWNRRKCVRAITQDQAQRCPVKMEETLRYFQSVWETSSSPAERIHSEPPTRPPIMDSFSQPFVAGCLRSAENSAPGQDLICYKHWRELDPSCSVLTRVFNICIKLSDVPATWKASRTVLIHKKGDVNNLENWRPITLSNTIYKLFTKCLAKKLSEWCEANNILSPAQKGFSPYDGVLEHNFLLTQHLEAARRCKTDKFVAWLDISNAFGSVPRQVVIDSLVACGADQDFVSLICSIYQGSNTCVLTDEGPTPPIRLLNGVKQGCPLSGILFNLSIDKVLQTIQENREHRAILAFADDIVLLANDAEDLQEMITATAHELSSICLRLNPQKCATLHLSGRVPTGSVQTKFRLDDAEIQALSDGDAYTYLGTPVGFFVQKHFKTANQALTILEKISTSHLAQWQKLDALKTFFFPTLSFSMRTGQLGKTDWSEVDVAARKEIKNILSLPSNASNHYIHGNRKLGGCGVPSAAEDSDFYLVDSAFKLLTSRDEDVSFEALGQLTRTVAHRIGRPPTDGDLGEYLSGSMEGKYAETTNQLSNTWTLARKASTRQMVSWSFTEGRPKVTIGDEVLSPMKRRGILKAFHDNFQVVETQNLLAAPSQGKAMDCVAMAPASSHFITDGNTPGLPTGNSSTRPLRHNAVLARIRAAIAFKGTILSENQVVGNNRLRPDLVAQIDKNIYIIDVTIPFENRRQAFSQARERKVFKYLELLPYFSSLGFQQVHIVPIIVGSLGAWDPENDIFLRKVATNRYLAVLRKLCVSDCIRWSRDIYIQHLTGAKQYSTDAPVHPPPQCTREQPNSSNDSGHSLSDSATPGTSNDATAVDTPTIDQSPVSTAIVDDQVAESTSASTVVEGAKLSFPPTGALCASNAHLDWETKLASFTAHDYWKTSTTCINWSGCGSPSPFVDDLDLERSPPRASTDWKTSTSTRASTVLDAISSVYVVDFE